MMRFRQQGSDRRPDALQLQGLARRPGRAGGVGPARRTSRTGPARPASAPGSAVLLAHDADATFGNATVTPLGRLSGATTMKIAFVTQPGHAVLPAAGSVEIWTARGRAAAGRPPRRHDLRSRSPRTVGRDRRRDRATASSPHAATARLRARRAAGVAHGAGHRQPYFASPLHPLSYWIGVGRELPPRALRRRARRQLLAGAADHPPPRTRTCGSCCTCTASGWCSSTGACSRGGCATPT